MLHEVRVYDPSYAPPSIPLPVSGLQRFDFCEMANALFFYHPLQFHPIKHPSLFNHPTQYHIIQIIRRYSFGIQADSANNPSGLGLIFSSIILILI